ncbi:sodium:solute symporter [Leptospira sp. 96542]|nr:sodium:solute symporter [Leptospira sp. 96542]
MIFDGIVLIIYFVFVFYIGFRFAKKSSSESDFYLAKKEIHWFYLMLSLVATETSSLTFLSVPSLSMKTDYRFLEIGIGYILGRTIVAFFLLPSYFSGNTISIYEYIGQKFGVSSQKSVSFIFTISRLLGDGIRLYVSSLPIAFLLEKIGLTYSNNSLGIAALFILSSATITYSVVGGFRAIVFTDVLQWFIYIFGGIFSIFLLLQSLGGFEKEFLFSLERLFELGKFSVFQTEYFTDSDNSYFVLYAVLGGAFISIGSHGTDLMLVQRVIATNNLKNARKILIGSGLVVLLQFFVFLGIGSLLFLFYENQNIAPDKAFSQYIIQNVPSPILGLLVSAVLASAMSTLSSTINSLSLTWARDWGFDRFFSPKTLSFLFGLVLFVSSLIPYFLAKDWEKGILEVGLTIFSYTLGSTIAVFVLAKRKTTTKIPDKLFACLFLLSIVILVCIGANFKIPFTLIIPLGFSILLFSFFFFQSLLRKKN